MPHELLRTKLQRPAVAPDILPRERLFRRLEGGLHGPLTLISAPAGYGKSTLASRWVAACGVPCVWLSLDKGEGDLRNFLRYVFAAIRSQFPEARFRSEEFLEVDHLPPPPVLAVHFSNDLEEIPERFILVLDDLHRAEGSPLPAFLAGLLAHPSQVMHLVLLTRKDPPLSLSRMRARGEVTEIRVADLRFRASEAAAFLSTLLGQAVDEATAALLEERIEGWATGLRLTGLYLRGLDNWEERVRELRGTSRHIAEYLVEEVLSQQDPEISDLLMETSILDRFCPSLCQAVHGGGDPRDEEGRAFETQRFMDWLIDANLFLVPLDEEGKWYRYHHLFQEFLRARLRRYRSVDEVAALHGRASEWHSQNGLLDGAIEHALAAGRTAAAVLLVLDHRHELMSNSEFRRLQGWLAQLPPDASESAPLLLTTRAFIGIEQGSDSDVHSFTSQAAEKLDRLSPGSAGYGALEAEVQVLRGFIEMATGNPERGLALSVQALASKDLPADALLVRSLATFSTAACHQMSGDLDSTDRVIREALSGPFWPPNLRARIHFYQAAIRYMDADLLGAMASCGECLRVLRGLPFTHTMTFASYLLGACRYWRNEIPEAEPHLLQTVEDYYSANPSYLANAGFILACIHLARGRPEDAENLLLDAEAHFRDWGSTTILSLFRAFQVEFFLRRERVGRAKELANGLDFDLRPPMWFFHVPQLTRMKLSLARGTARDLEDARSGLAELDRQMAKGNRKNARIDALALLALVHARLGDETGAMEALGAALSLAEPGGWVRNFIDLGEPMKALVGRLTLERPTHGHGNRVLAAFESEARVGPLAHPSGQEKSRLPPKASNCVLSPREQEILCLLSEGMSNKAIASGLHIATETVKTHLQNIYGKLNARNRVGALKQARLMGILDQE